MLKNLAKYQIAIVVLGSFNPTIVQPLWLSAKKLIRDDEGGNAKISVIHGEVSQFALEWVDFSITHDRFEVSCSAASFFEPLKDLVLGIFTILKETPVTAFGINHIVHFDLGNLKNYTDFGTKLVPLSVWDSVFEEPRLANIEIQDRKSKQKYSGSNSIKIAPSAELNTGPQKYHIMIQTNDHYEEIKDCFILT